MRWLKRFLDDLEEIWEDHFAILMTVVIISIIGLLCGLGTLTMARDGCPYTSGRMPLSINSVDPLREAK